MEKFKGVFHSTQEDGGVSFFYVGKGYIREEALGKPSQADESLRKQEIEADRNNVIFDAALIPTGIFIYSRMASGLKEKSVKKILTSAFAGVLAVTLLKTLSFHYKKEVEVISDKRQRLEDFAA